MKIQSRSARPFDNSPGNMMINGGKSWTSEEEDAFKSPIREQYERQGHPYYATARLWDDGIIAPAETRRVLQTLVQPSAFMGAAFASDGHTLYASGGNRDCVYVYAWGDSATLRDSIALGPPPDSTGGRVYPALLSCSPDGSRLYVAGNLDDALLVVDVRSHRVTQRLATGAYPYGVVVAPDGHVYVSAWGAAWVASFMPQRGRLAPGPRIGVGRHHGHRAGPPRHTRRPDL